MLYKRIKEKIEKLKKYEDFYLLYEHDYKNEERYISSLPYPINLTRAISVKQFNASSFLIEVLNRPYETLNERLQNAYFQLECCIDDNAKGRNANRLVSVNEYVLYRTLFYYILSYVYCDR